MMFGEGAGHVLEGKEGHTAPPGFHFVVVWGTFMPWSLLLPLAIVTGWRHRKIPEIRFALAAVVGPWVMVELIGTKLPHYFLAAFGALAYLVAFTILRCLRGESVEPRSRPFLIVAGVWAVAIAAFGLAPWLAARWFRPLPWAAMIFMSGFAVAYALTVYILLLKHRFAPAFCAMGLGMLAAIAITCGFYLPAAPFLRISPHVAEVLRQQGATHPGDVRMVDYKEPSLAFYQGGTIREEPNEKDLLNQPLTRWPRWWL